MTPADLLNRFGFHPATDPAVGSRHGNIRAVCHRLAEQIVELTPEGREQSLAITHVEEAMFWANAAIARHASSEPILQDQAAG